MRFLNTRETGGTYTVIYEQSCGRQLGALSSPRCTVSRTTALRTEVQEGQFLCLGMDPLFTAQDMQILENITREGLRVCNTLRHERYGNGGLFCPRSRDFLLVCPLTYSYALSLSTLTPDVHVQLCTLRLESVAAGSSESCSQSA